MAFFDFRQISYKEWRKLVVYLANYDIISSEVELTESFRKSKMQLEAFLKKRGKIPAKTYQLKELVEKRNDEIRAYNKQIEYELEENYSNIIFDNEIDTFAYQKKDLLIDMTNIDKKQFDKKFRKFFIFLNNPYYLDDLNDQKYKARKHQLINELKNIEIMLKDSDKIYKKSKKKLLAMKKTMFEIFPTFTENSFKDLLDFVRPYMTNIVENESFFYDELIEMSVGMQ